MNLYKVPTDATYGRNVETLKNHKRIVCLFYHRINTEKASDFLTTIHTRLKRSMNTFILGLLLTYLVYIGLDTKIVHAQSLDLLSQIQFRELIQDISEETGDFPSHNFVSNESSYLHPIPILRNHKIQGGVYIGVGPEQNYSYIAEIKPDIAFIVDIRRQNMLQHLLFKALCEFAEKRVDYLSLLLSLPLPHSMPWGEREPSIREIVDFLRSIKPDYKMYQRTLKKITTELAQYGITDRVDYDSVEFVFRSFYERQFQIKYELTVPPYHLPYNYPDFEDLLVATTLEGEPACFLATRDRFEFINKMHERNLIVPVVGNLGSNKVLQSISDYTKAQKKTISAFYTSNVEVYLNSFDKPAFESMIESVRSFPITSKSVFIRAYHNDHHLECMSHPDRVGDHVFTTTVQPIAVFLGEQNRYYNDPTNPSWRGFYRYVHINTYGTLK